MNQRDLREFVAQQMQLNVGQLDAYQHLLRLGRIEGAIAAFEAVLRAMDGKVKPAGPAEASEQKAE